MIHCIIIEDQTPAQEILKAYIEKISNLKLEGIFSDTLSAKEYLKTHVINLILLDVNLPKSSGMEFLSSSEKLPQIILTTAYTEYAVESYEYSVTDYLLKPFSFERFSKAILKVEGIISRGLKSENYSIDKELNSIYVKSNYELIKVATGDIFLIKSDNDYTEIIVRETKYLTSESLRQWNTKLNDRFCQVHKSYIVNLDHIEKIVADKVHLSNGQVVPIGRVYKKEFKKEIEKMGEFS